MPRAGRPVQVYLPDDTVKRLRTLAEGNRRTLTAEIEAAIERYLTAPEVVQPGPPLPPVEPAPKRPRGRPRKTPAEEPAPESVGNPVESPRPRGRPRKPASARSGVSPGTPEQPAPEPAAGEGDAAGEVVPGEGGEEKPKKRRKRKGKEG